MEELTRQTRLTESNNFSVEDFVPGTVFELEDGEQWIVIEKGLVKRAYIREPDDITVKPYNKIAKDNNVGLAIDMSLNYLNKSIRKIIKK
jgi:hypothetical protein